MIPGVPYDAEIEYLQSTGTQWIDTGILAFTNDSEADKQTITYIGKISPLNTSGYRLHCTTVTNSAWWGVNNGYWRLGDNNSSVQYTPGTIYNIEVYTTIKSNDKSYMAINGVEVLRTTRYSSKNNAAPIFLFASCQNVNGTSAAFNGSWRIYDLKLYYGSTLVRDFIPVRVGQTGYMYDRVSKRLFGNKGTGSFVLGPDVAKPVIGLWGFKSLTAKDYISNGLVAMWDGIENAGWGRHTESPDLFKELVSGQPALVGGQFGSNLTTDPNYEITENGLKSNTVGGNYAIGVGVPFTTNLGNNWTIEWCRYAHSIPRLQAFVNTIMVYPYVNHNGRIYEYLLADGSTFRQKYSGEWNTKVIESSGSGSTFAITCNPTARRICYKNGTAGSTNSNSFSFYYSANTTHIGFGTNKIGATLYAFRIYNRALSASEISFNHKIDKERFNLP